MATELNQEELVAVFAEAAQAIRDEEEDGDGLTKREIAGMLGRTIHQVNPLVTKMLDKGSLIPVRIRRKNRWGIVHTVNGYRLAEVAEEK